MVSSLRSQRDPWPNGEQQVCRNPCEPCNISFDELYCFLVPEGTRWRANMPNQQHTSKTTTGKLMLLNCFCTACGLRLHVQHIRAMSFGKHDSNDRGLLAASAVFTGEHFTIMFCKFITLHELLRCFTSA